MKRRSSPARSTSPPRPGRRSTPWSSTATVRRCICPAKSSRAGPGRLGRRPGTAAATAYVLDMTAPSPAWRQIPSMAFARAYHNTTLLPDGSVLVTGGGSRRDGHDEQYAVKQTELWSPVTETWTTLAPAATPRLYHSSALLLPDARVLVAGSGNDSGMVDRTAAEIFSPPYLFRGARPVIGSVPSVLSYASRLPPADGRRRRHRIGRADPPGRGDAFVRRGSALRPADVRAERGIAHHSSAREREPRAARLLHAVHRQQQRRAVDRRVGAVRRDGSGHAASERARVVGGAAVVRHRRALVDRVDRQHRRRALQRAPLDDVGLHARRGEQDRRSDRDQLCEHRACGRNLLLRRHRPGCGRKRERAVERSGRAGAWRYDGAERGDDGPGRRRRRCPGTLPVSATASDDVGVASVQFTVDGAAVGSADTSAPFTIQWNSSTVPNGLHAISAVARDAAGNTTAGHCGDGRRVEYSTVAERPCRRVFVQ